MKIKNKEKTIIYVNFAPYENAGGILDFLKKKFKYVALFSFSFHRLNKRLENNKLKVYFSGKKVDSKNLFDFQVPEKLIFLFLPIRSILIFLQIIFYTIYLTYTYGGFENYFTVNAFTAWTGNILKKTGFVKKTIFWVYDYYPPFHENKTIVFMRWLYWQFDKWATKSDMLVFLNSRIVKLRKEIGVLSDRDRYKIIPIGTTNKSKRGSRNLKPNSKIKLVFLGVMKKSQGLNLIFECSNQIATTFPNLEINIIGDGPDLEYFKSNGEKTNLKIKYHGYPSDNDIDEILGKSHIGIATYIPNQENVSYYGDPSKIKGYLSFGLPVITTNVFEFSKEIKSFNAGVLIGYKKENMIKAITKIVNNYSFYRSGAKKLAKKYYYKNLYPNMFKPY
ncbi:MAG: glycosyltransferase [Patescibacteria group bacterium]